MAASTMALKKVWAQQSSRIAMGRQFLSLPNMISIRWRWRYRMASCGMGTFRQQIEGMRVAMLRAARSARKLVCPLKSGPP